MDVCSIHARADGKSFKYLVENSKAYFGQLLGALASTAYKFRPIPIGFCALSMVVGALLAVPFQKASIFSRARTRPPRTDSMTIQQSVSWTSHLVRRIAFTALLPLAAVGYALSSWGPPFPIAVPCLLSAAVAYLSNLALAECSGLIMETFDTSDLQPGMTGKPLRRTSSDQSRGCRTNFSCYPRVSAGLAVKQSLQMIFAAAATGVGGRIQRRLGARYASLVVAGILLGLTLLLTFVLCRWNVVQMVPDRRRVRRATVWEPIILGNPSGIMRKLNILESGRQSRWSEIRRRNRLNSGLTTA
jgi:hypothetical protein